MIQTIQNAFNSLLAHRRKTWAIVASIALGICTLVLVGGYYEYTCWGLGQSLIRAQYGHLQIYPKGYQRDRDINAFAHGLDRSAELIALLEQDPAIKAVAPRSRAWGLANGKPVEVRGIDPDREAEIFTFTTSKRGIYLQQNDISSCQIAPALAETVGAELNGNLVLSGVRADNQLNVIDLKVQTIIGSYSMDFDQTTVSVPQATFADLFGTNQVHEIAILYKDDRNLPAIRDKLQTTLAAQGWNTEITVWSEQARFFSQVVDYYQGFYQIVLGIVAIIVFFATGTTMSLSLMERTREFGTCLSMGTRRATLITGILTEALVAGFLGLATGSLLAVAGSALINIGGGIAMPAAPGMTTDIHVYIRYSSQAVFLGIATALLVPLAAVLLPARRIMQQSIIRLLNKGES